MNDTLPQSTMRELQRQFSTSTLWIALAAVSLLLGVVGPFGTYGERGLLERIAYWTVVAVSTYAVGAAAIGLVIRWWHPDGRAGPGLYAAAGAFAGLPVFVMVYVFNGFVFGFKLGLETFYLALSCVLIASVVSALVALFAQAGSSETASALPTPASTTTEPSRPPILQRLPPGLRGHLAYLSMQDHYVDVHTDKGATLVLMRFADAVAETTGVAGLRIHRSHWVAKGAIAGTVRRDGRLCLKMRDGAELPVSRPYLSAVREAGLAGKIG